MIRPATDEWTLEDLVLREDDVDTPPLWKDLTVASGLAMASVTNLIDRLEAKGFVRRTRSSPDRRRVVVEPAVDREAAARQLFASTRRSLTHLYAKYSDDELRVIADFLNQNAKRLRIETRKVADATASRRR